MLEEVVVHRRTASDGSEMRISVVENRDPCGFSVCIERTHGERTVWLSLLPEDARGVAEAFDEGERRFGRPSRASER